MRDQEKWRDRVELSLDSRQVFALFAAAALALTLAFVLGIVVGKRVQGDVVPQAQTDPLALLDQLSAGEQDHADALSFPEALTTGATGAARRDPLPPSAPAPSAAAGPATPANVAPPLPAAAQQEVAPAPARQQVAAPPRVLPRAIAAAPASRRAATPPAALPSVPIAVAPAAAEGDYSLQVSAFQDRLEAQQFLRQLERRGLHPQLVQAEVPGRGTWYRVRLGRYKSWEQAVDAKQHFERSNGVIAYVARN
ncbi:MAG: SPOR domain-containing protein [Proteobacteria bacterium]|nr:SPOR domain-containing protein [Pseudomonadota bacterium]